MRTNIDLDEKLMRRAARLTSLNAEGEIVHHRSRTARELKDQERIWRYRGKLRWWGELDSVGAVRLVALGPLTASTSFV